MKSLSDKINWINDAIDWISLVQKTATTSSTMSGAKIVRGTNSNDDIIDDFGNDTIYAGASNDTLDGGFGRDVLHGEAGNDVFRALEHNDKLYGGLGNDTMESGTGSDIMMFNTALNSRTNVDRIDDFSVRYDTIHLENKIFTKLTKTGALSSSAFWTGTKAHDSNDKIIYNKTTGYQYYDQDGTGSKAAALFAKLDKGLALTDKDSTSSDAHRGWEFPDLRYSTRQASRFLTREAARPFCLANPDALVSVGAQLEFSVARSR